MKALANATTNSKAHVLASTTAGRFTLADLNALMTLAKRISTSFVGGTPEAGQGRGITDILVSPEIVEELRAIAYNPINTKSSPAVVADSGATAQDVQTADVIAQQAFNAAGAPEFYGINVIELNEFGSGQTFNKVFDAEYGSAFSEGSEEIVVGIDRSRESLIRPVAVDSESGGEFNLIADDQYSIRQSKIGYFGSLEEGRIVLDDRALVGKIV
jgi:hypothetical protein